MFFFCASWAQSLICGYLHTPYRQLLTGGLGPGAPGYFHPCHMKVGTSCYNGIVRFEKNVHLPSGHILRIDYCGLGTFCGTPINLIFFISQIPIIYL